MKRALVGKVSVVIPARNESRNIERVIQSVTGQHLPDIELEIIVVNDGSTDNTAVIAEQTGATVVNIAGTESGGSAGACRNRGAAASRGEVIVFLDANCSAKVGWLESLLVTIRSASVVGGSFGLPKGLSVVARCDYYCGWYHHHPGRTASFVEQHPPGNLAVWRAVFEGTSGFVEEHPVAYAHEELKWQREVLDSGGTIYFEPDAVVSHWNRAGVANLLKRNYRWGYSAIEAKAESGIARMSFAYRFPLMLIAISIPLAFPAAIYIIAVWVRAGAIESLWMSPLILLARLSYACGMAVGGIYWLRHRGTPNVVRRPRWE